MEKYYKNIIDIFSNYFLFYYFNILLFYMQNNNIENNIKLKKLLINIRGYNNINNEDMKFIETLDKYKLIEIIKIFKIHYHTMIEILNDNKYWDKNDIITVP